MKSEKSFCRMIDWMIKQRNKRLDILRNMTFSYGELAYSDIGIIEVEEEILELEDVKFKVNQGHNINDFLNINYIKRLWRTWK